jgi:hypothetical protein
VVNVRGLAGTVVDVLTVLMCVDAKSASWFDQWVMEIELPAGTLMAVEIGVEVLTSLQPHIPLLLR